MNDLNILNNQSRAPHVFSSSGLCLKNSSNDSPIRLSDPDIFITFESPKCYPQPESPLDGSYSPRSEDVLEKTIKKLRLDGDYVEVLPQKPEFCHLPSPQKETWEEENSIPFPYNQCPFGRSTQENTSAYRSSPSYYLTESPCPMNPNNHKANINRAPIVEENEDDLIILDEMPENFGNENKCPRLAGSGDVMKVKQGAKSIYETKMLSGHEKLLWQSFAKVHSHIPNFPLKENKHFDYISLILRHKAEHLFQIGRQNQQSYIQSKEERYKAPNLSQTPGPVRIENNPPIKTSPLMDPRLVFEKPDDQALLNKCPVMNDLFNSDKSSAPRQDPQIPNSSNPTPNYYHPHHQFSSGPVDQQQMHKNPINNENTASLMRMFGGFHGMDFNNFGNNVDDQFKALLSLCPKFHKTQDQNSSAKPQGRERRAAFSKAVCKMKGSTKQK